MSRPTPTQVRAQARLEKRTMLAALDRQGRMTFDELVAAAMLPEARVRTLLSGLQRSGLVCGLFAQDGSRLYELWTHITARMTAAAAAREARSPIEKHTHRTGRVIA